MAATDLRGKATAAAMSDQFQDLRSGGTLDALRRLARPGGTRRSTSLSPPTAAEPPAVFFLKSLLGPAVAVASLLVSLLICSRRFEGTYFLLAVLGFLAAGHLLQPMPFRGGIRDRDSWHALFGTTVRWALIVSFLWFLVRAAGIGDRVHGHVFGTWIVLMPLGLWLGQWLAKHYLHSVGVAAVPMRRAVIVGLTDPGLRLHRELESEPLLRTEVLGFFEDRSPERHTVESENSAPIPRVLGKLPELAQFVLANRVSVVYIALPMTHHPRVVQLLDALRDSTASVYFVPDLMAFNTVGARFDQISQVPVVAIRESPLLGMHALVKRTSDIVISLTAILITAPVVAAVAIGIRMTSPGPVLFRQRRYGLDGLPIIIYKFRSMTVTEDGESRYTQVKRQDTRVTTFGSFLRRTSLDELPQLFNVLQGTMSMVGPRPHAIAVNEQYRRLIPGYMTRHKVKPGITGWAQVNGYRGGDDLESMRKRIEFDLDYVQNWSLGLDLMIILRTAAVVWADRRAY